MARTIKKSKKTKTKSAKKTKAVKKVKKAKVASSPSLALIAPAYSYDEICEQVISCLRSITDVHEIYSTDEMDGPKFHYNTDALRALAEELKQCFANAHKPIPKPINLNKIGKAKTVEDVCDVVAAAFGL